MDVTEKTFVAIIFTSCQEMLGHFPAESHGKLRKLVVEAFEKGLFKAAYQFCQGNKKRLANMLGISLSTVEKRIKRFNVPWLGTCPKDVDWIGMYRALYPPYDNPKSIVSILEHIEFSVLRWTCLYLFHGNQKTINYLYEVGLEEIEKPLIILCHAKTAGVRRAASQLLGIDVKTMRNKMRLYGIKGR